MPRRKGLLSVRGKPKGLGVPFLSKSVVVCRVDGCIFTKRNDKVKDHQRDLVLWNLQGDPASELHPGYADLNDEERKHTDWFKKNGFNSTKFPLNKRLNSEGPLDKFFSPKQRREELADVTAANSDDTDDPDDPDPEDSDNQDKNNNDSSDCGGDGESSANVNSASFPVSSYPCLGDTVNNNTEQESESDGSRNEECNHRLNSDIELTPPPRSDEEDVTARLSCGENNNYDKVVEFDEASVEATELNWINEMHIFSPRF